jgi:outer membrane phospholipase A
MAKQSRIAGFIGFLSFLCLFATAFADDMSTVVVPDYLDNMISGPTTQASTEPLFQLTYNKRTISEFIGHFSGYDPIYFVAGPVNPLAKFQFSFKYQIFNTTSQFGQDQLLANKYPLLAGLHFSYSQLSTWQLNVSGAPFYDNNYRPEFFYSNEDIKAIHLPGVAELGLQTGIGHESNGLGGSTSERAINFLFLRPILDFGDPEKFHFYIAPKAYVYIFGVPDNPDISHYRGYCDLRSVIGWRQGLELSFLGRIGSDYNRGSIQLDLTYPIRDLLRNNVDLYLDAQYFNGYGETLRVYNQRTQAFRIGFALVR